MTAASGRPRRTSTGRRLIRPSLCVLAALMLATWVGVWAEDGANRRDDSPRFTEWTAPVNLGSTVNSAFTEAGTFITRDGLSLYFSSSRPGGYGGLDLWVSRRPTVDADWEAPQNLGPTLNAGGSDTTPAVSVDGHRLYFASERPGGLGGLDLYVSRRHDERDDFGWEPPVNLGDAVNTAFVERGPTRFENEATGTITLYFSSTRQGGLGLEDIWASTLQWDDTYAPAVNVAALNSAFGDSVPSVRRDGLEIFLASARAGQLGGSDLWVATRPSSFEPWGAPVNLGALINSPVLDFRPAISFDGTALYFHSARPGGFGEYDLYVTTRSKLQGPR